MKILLTNIHMQNFGGSELVTLELAEEYFKHQGHDVLIYSPQIAEPLKSHITVPTTKTPPADLDQFDIIWVHHGLLLDQLKPSRNQKIIFNHMSSYTEEEFPKNAEKENDLAWEIFANSIETRNKMNEFGLKYVEVFPNPAPREFTCPKPFRPEYGLFVSNHRPREIERMALTLGIDCLFIGARDKFQRLTPEIISKAAFVVCNGKTVQYALRACIPVFLYDQFGGPGWLDYTNIEKAAEFNFSGRGFGRSAKLSELSKWQNREPYRHVPQLYKLENFLLEYGL